MKRILGVVCGLLALCAAGHITVHAEDNFIDEDLFYGQDDLSEDSLSDLPEDVDVVSSDDFQTDVPDVIEDDSDSDYSFGHFVDGDDNSLSDGVLDMLDRLGDLLDYNPSVSENDVGDLYPDDPFGSDLSGDGVVDVLYSIDDSLSTLSGASLYSDFTAFNGAISSTYLDLFRGFLPKLSYKEHYVLYRESQYIYSFVYGENLSFSGSSFSGSTLTRVYFNAYNTGTFGHSLESSFTLAPGAGVVYTDLGSYYPSLSCDTGSQLIQIKWVLLVSILAFWMISLYKGFRRRGDRDKRWSSVNTV